MHILTDARAFATVLRTFYRDATPALDTLELRTDGPWLIIAGRDDDMFLERRLSAIVHTTGRAVLSARSAAVLQHLVDGSVEIRASPRDVHISQGETRQYALPQTPDAWIPGPDLPVTRPVLGRLSPMRLQALLAPLAAVHPDAPTDKSGFGTRVLMAMDATACALAATDGNAIATATYRDVPTTRVVVRRNALHQAAALECAAITVRRSGEWIEYDGGESGRVLALAEPLTAVPDVFAITGRKQAPSLPWTVVRRDLRESLQRLALIDAPALPARRSESTGTPGAFAPGAVAPEARVRGAVDLQLTAKHARVSVGTAQNRGYEQFAGLPTLVEPLTVAITGRLLQRALRALDASQLALDLPPNGRGLLRLRELPAEDAALDVAETDPAEVVVSCIYLPLRATIAV